MKLTKLILGVATILFALTSQAQQKFSNFIHVADTKFPYDYIENDPANARFYTLPNGLTVILARNTEKPTIQTLIATKAGSKNDPSNNTGLAHYLEHLLFKGTDKYGTSDFKTESIYLAQIDSLYNVYNKTTDEQTRKLIYKAIDSTSQIAAAYAIPNEYDKLMQIIGASGTNAFTSFEQTVYVNQIPSNEINRWLEIEAERFRNPILRIFHTELEAVYEEKNISMDNDMNKIFESLFAALFPNHTYGTQTTIGTIEHLKNPSLEAIRNYYQTYYVPNNMAVIMAGDLDFDQTIQAVYDRFSYMTPKPIPSFEFKPETTKNEPTVINITGPTAEMVVLGYRFPGDGTKEADLLRMMDLVLSNSTAGLIDLNLNKSQKVLGAGSESEFLKDYSVHYFYAMPKEGQSLEEAKNLILEQIQAVQNGNFDENLMKGIIFNQEVNDIKNFEDNQGTAYTLLDAFVKNLKWIDVLNANYRMSKITKQDLMDFAKKYYNNDYVIIYKKQGENEQTKKIEKPQITKIPVNRDRTSDFVKHISEEKINPISPQFPDFKKDMTQGNYGIAPFFYIPNKRNELFTLYYVIDAGTYSNKELSLALDYLEYMGTDKYSPAEISEKFYSLGCSFGVSAGARQSYVYLSGLQQNFEPALELFEHLLANMKPDEEALFELKGRLLKSRENNKSNKGAIRTALNYYALYGADNPQRFILKNKEIEKIKSNKLIKSIKELLKTKHDIVYYGPGSSEEILGLITKYHNLPKKFAKSPKMKSFTMLHPKEPMVYFANYDMVQAEITWQKPTHTFNKELLPIVSMFNEYFGGGMSSIVFQEIREAQALAYSTYAYYYQANYPKEFGKMLAYVGTQSDKMPSAISSMDDLIQNLPQNQTSFDQAKSSLENSIRTSRTTKTGIYFAWKTTQLLDLPKTANEIIFGKLNDITLSDVVNFQNIYVKQGVYTLSILANKNSVTDEALKKYGKVVKLNLDELFGY
ncbi:MAG: insulinase family protein [Bacteroidetes bacterium]|nr:insulinase family protein [Bacteroidota bacterium]